VRPAFHDPSPGLASPAEHRFLDLLRVSGGPTLLLTYRAEPEHRLRRVYSSSGFLRPGPPGEATLARLRAGDPVLAHRAGCLADLPFSPLATCAAELAAARDTVERVFRLAGPGLERVRLYAAAAHSCSVTSWAAHTRERSVAEEQPYDELVTALLDLAGVGDQPGLTLHDPACHHGTTLATLAGAFPRLQLGAGDRDPAWIAAACAAVAHRGGCCRPSLPGSVADLPGCAPASVDVLLLRALNRGVVSFSEACRALTRAVEVVRSGGLIFLYGYSHPLVNSYHLERLGLDVLVQTVYLQPSPLHTRGPVPFYVAARG